jgi:hypothetical protein
MRGVRIEYLLPTNLRTGCGNRERLQDGYFDFGKENDNVDCTRISR